jgi:PAS domain S-box-containing protein
MVRNDTASFLRLLGAGSPSTTRVVEVWLLCAAIPAVEAFDRFAAPYAGFAVSAGFLVAVLLRRPAFAPLGFVLAFVAGTLVRIPSSGLAAPVPALFDVLLGIGTWLVCRVIHGDGRRVRTGRALVEILTVAAFAAPLLAASLTGPLVDTAAVGWIDVGRTVGWPGEILGAAIVVPVVLVAGFEESNDRLRRSELMPFAVAGSTVAVVAWSADHWFPFPFIVACIPLLVAATRLQPVAVALLGAGCMIEMTVLPASAHADLVWARAVAAALTGALPTGLALLLAELRTERRRMTEAGEQLHKLLAGIAGHGFYRLDRDGTIVGWGEKIAAITGFSAEVVLGRSFAIFFPEEERVAGVPAALLVHASETGRAERIGWRFKADGTRFWTRSVIEAQYDERGALTGFLKSVQDQSELQHSQNALMAAERRWGFALGSAGQGIWEHDLADGTMHYSDVYTAMLGLAPGSLGDDPQAWKDRVHPDDVDRIPPDDAGTDGGETELRLRHAEDRWIWVADRRSVAERDGDGQPLRVIGIHTDITARKLAEEKFRLAVEAAPNGVLIVVPDGRITLVNSETERMFGYEPGTLLGRSIDLLVPDAQYAAHAAHRTAFAASPRAGRMGAGRDLSGRRRDGSLFPVEIGLNPIKTAEGASVLCVVTDITARRQAQADLALSEARYRSMADNFVDLVVQLDLDLTRTWISPASRDILGVPPEVLLGSQPAGIVHPDDYAMVRRTLLAVAGGEDRGAYTARYRHADGHWLWLSVALRLVRGADAEPVGILAVARDITRARAAEEQLKASETTFRGAMESASIGMALEEPDGRWITVNRALCGILGMAEADLVGRDRDAATHPDDVGSDDEQRRRLLAGEITSYQIEKRCLHRGGGVVWTHRSVSLDRHPDGSPRRLIVQIQDVTERKQIEQMKSEFVSMVSHELRTPLTSIRGALGLILGTMVRELPPRAVQLVDIAHKNSERLIPLINDILDLDKIDAGMLRVDIVETDVIRLVVQAAEQTRTFADRYGVELVVAKPPMDVVGARVDEGRFIQVVTNLLSNAAKFSPRGGTVEVSVRVAAGRVRVAVRDEGPGIPEEFRSRIFGRFAQADSATTRAKGGSGLGLHICRQLIGLMGGEIDFESSIGVGSTFWVEFPLSVAAAVPGASGAPANGRRQVMILGREAFVVDFLAAAVASAGLEPRIGDLGTEPPVEAAEQVAAVLVDAADASSPVVAALRGHLRGSEATAPPVIPVAVGPESDAEETPGVWVVDPATPRDFVRRLASLVSGNGGPLPRILHVEDDSDFAEVIGEGLAGRAEVVRVSRGGHALELLERETFDLAVIDPVLPDGDGVAVLAPRLERLGTPYLVLSAGEAAQHGGVAVHLVKSRVSEPQVVDAIFALVAEARARKPEDRHVG